MADGFQPFGQLWDVTAYVHVLHYGRRKANSRLFLMSSSAVVVPGHTTLIYIRTALNVAITLVHAATAIRDVVVLRVPHSVNWYRMKVGQRTRTSILIRRLLSFLWLLYPNYLQSSFSSLG